MKKNKYSDRIIDCIQDSKSRILLPESDDVRVKKAIPILESLGIEIISCSNYEHKIEFYCEYLKSKSFTSNWPVENIYEYLKNPLHFSMAMLACDDADGLIAGASTPSAEVIRAAIRVIGIKIQSNIVSSVFFMISPNCKNVFTFGDCAVVPEPDANQLVEIAYEASKFHKLITGINPKVAFLSFSSKGSAEHYRVDKVRDAVNIFKKKFPEIIHDGEIQLDAAIIPSINKIKVSNSQIEGSANVLIFPNLDAGNIGYKLTQHLAGYTAWGPFLQGLNKPVHDLSRGCSTDDIINVSLVTSLQKKEYANV